MKYLIAIIIVTALTGCGTAPKGAFKIEDGGVLKNNESVIAICRPSAMVASAISPDVLINGEVVAELGSGGVLEVVKKVGKFNLQFKSTTFGKPEGFGINSELSEGASKYFLMAPNLESLVALPIAGYFASSVSVRWQVAEASRSTFEARCAGNKRIRLRSVTDF